MPKTPDIGIDNRAFRRIAKTYRERWGVNLCAVNLQGEVIFGRRGCCAGCAVECATALVHVTREGLRWGDPTIYEHADGRLLWGVPLMHNADIIGGLVACADDESIFPPDGGDVTLDLTDACRHLRLLAEEANVTNAALLERNRQKGLSEQRRAEAIHEIKGTGARSILESYLREEPHLLSAIRQGNRGEAVGILNRILVEIYHHGSGRLDLVKSFLMELVVTMCRTAIESGGAPQELFGTNYKALSELGAIDNEEELSAWLVRMLSRILDHMEAESTDKGDTDLRLGIEFVHAHFAEPIGRDDAARAARMSPSHFSRTLKEKTGRGFTDLLNQVRVDRATELLRKSNLSLSQIAFEVGFSDQSYFTKVFRRHMRCTPRDYRLQAQRKD